MEWICLPSVMDYCGAVCVLVENISGDLVALIKYLLIFAITLGFI